MLINRSVLKDKESTSMSKRIAYVKDIHIESPGGEPYYRVPGTDKLVTVDVLTVQVKDEVVEQRLPPFLVRQVTFLYERVADAKFADEKLEAIEADLYRADVRGLIKRQATDAAARGYWEFEDDIWVKLLAVTMKPSSPPNPAVGFNYVPFVRAIRDASTPPAEVELPAVTNSVPAQA